MVRENRIQEYGASLSYKYITNGVGENPLNGSAKHLTEMKI